MLTNDSGDPLRIVGMAVTSRDRFASNIQTIRPFSVQENQTLYPKSQSLKRRGQV